MTRRELGLLLAAPQALRAAERPLLKLASAQAAAAFDLLGGGLVDFHLQGQVNPFTVNPFTWEQAGQELEPRPRGHFLCLDRWGAPSAAEARNGMPFHGEASHIAWTAQGPNRMSAELPMARLLIERTASLEGAVLTVRETLTNQNLLGRIYNMVQHPTIAPPFLDGQTFVDSNAGQGFAQAAPNEAPRPWPQGQTSDLRRLTNDPLPNVVSFVIEGEQGWVTACSPTAGLMVGYLWKTADYPWLNIWRDVKNGQPSARGLEFGTTGLHQPYPELVRRGRMLGRPLYSHLDAGEAVERSYQVFLKPLPPKVSRVTSVRPAPGGIDVTFG